MSSSRRVKAERVTDVGADWFLAKLVNLYGPPTPTLLNHPVFVSMLPTVGISRSGSTDQPYMSQVMFDPSALTSDWLQGWRDKLREAWVERRTPLRRDKLRSMIHAYVALKVIRDQYTVKERVLEVKGVGGGKVLGFDRSAEREFLEPPGDSAIAVHDAFLQVLHRGAEIAKRMKLCRNRECQHPFFLAERRTQKYCTQECARPAKSAAKLRWWNKHGKKERQKQKAKRRKRGGK